MYSIYDRRCFYTVTNIDHIKSCINKLIAFLRQ